MPAASRARALFILGVPRSGTTLLGNYLGSSPSAVNLAEFGGFYLAHSLGPDALRVLPGHHQEEYLQEIQERTRAFAERLAESTGRSWYVDSTPRNLQVAAALARALPDALFVLTVRHYAGSILSLRQLPWFGSSWEDNARLWVELNAFTSELPRDRLMVVSYDSLAAAPGATFNTLPAALRQHGFDTARLDDRMLALSHAAVVGQPRPTIGFVEDDVVHLQSIPSFDANRWSGDIHKVVWPLVKDMHRELMRLFPDVYRCPPPPQALTMHDPVAGLVPYELEGW